MNRTKILVITDFEDGYTFEELAIALAKYRGSKIPPSTLRRWIKTLCIEAEDGIYDAGTFAYLVRLVFWLKRGLSISSFVQKLIEEISNDSDQCESTTESNPTAKQAIEVDSKECNDSDH